MNTRELDYNSDDDQESHYMGKRKQMVQYERVFRDSAKEFKDEGFLFIVSGAKEGIERTLADHLGITPDQPPYLLLVDPKDPP